MKADFGAVHGNLGHLAFQMAVQIMQFVEPMMRVKADFTSVDRGTVTPCVP